MSRIRRRAVARTLARPTPDLRWAALAAAALAALYGLAEGWPAIAGLVAAQ